MSEKETVTMREFERIDLRIGKVIGAEKIPGMKKILKVKVDVGSRMLEMIAGGAEYYSLDFFLGKNVVVLANLEPKMIAGVQSKGMLLAADLGGKPIWLSVKEDVPPGTKVR